VTNQDCGLKSSAIAKKKKRDVLMKKRADDVLMNTNSGGKQSEKLMEKLTLFTKSKLVKQ
jgi:hypothetical protein